MWLNVEHFGAPGKLANYNMLPLNGRRQSRDSRLWARPPNMGRRSALSSRRSMGHEVTEADSLNIKSSRKRYIPGPGGYGYGYRPGGDGYSSEPDEDDPVQQTAPIPSSSSGSIVTITSSLLPASSSAQQKEEGDGNDDSSPSPILTTETPSSTTATTTHQPTETSWKLGDGNDEEKHGGPRGGKNFQQGGLDRTAEHLLIAAGAIGAFILFCFTGWITYRVLKRSRGQGFGGNSGAGFIDKFYGRRRVPVDEPMLYMANEAPPMYEKGEYGTMQSGAFYGPTKTYIPGLGSMTRPVTSNSNTGTLRRPLDNNPIFTSPDDKHKRNNEDAVNEADINLTMRSLTSQPYYTESGLARRPSDIYSAPKGAGSRASELSSISSGFGDGDIVVPPPFALSKPLPALAPERAPGGPLEKPAVRESWISRQGDRRETVYTVTSEDRPARFRSITSWVNQQAGRAKRAGSRARERGEVPVIPAIPGEISVTQQTVYR